MRFGVHYKDMANQFLSLSLFVMLLSFFIILNTMSNFEEVKARPVLNSLAATFSNKETKQEILSPNVVESDEQGAKEGDTLSEIESLFNAHITGVKVRKNREGTEMHVRMNVNAFERSLTAPVRSAWRKPGVTDEEAAAIGAPGSFLPVLISLMQSTDMDNPYRMDMVLNTEKPLPDIMSSNPDGIRASLQRVAMFAQKMEQSGLARKMVSAGLAKGNANMIDLYFRKYETINPLVSKSDAKGIFKLFQ